MDEEFSVDSTVQQIEALLEKVGQTDPGLRGAAEELLRLLMQLYGAGLGRAVGILREAGHEDVLASLAEDRLVASLLLLHGIHPVDAETRVRAALRRLERGLESHHLEFKGIEDGVAQVTVVRDRGGRLPAGFGETIEHAITDCAPDLDGVKVEGLTAASLVQIAPVAS
jgi:hypothetical protein